MYIVDKDLTICSNLKEKILIGLMVSREMIHHCGEGMVAGGMSMWQLSSQLSRAGSRIDSTWS